MENRVHPSVDTPSESPDAKSIEKTEVLERGKWGGKLEFILTCIGYTVGLGNVWRFPYLCFKNGGGAFLIPYWCMQLFVGMPLFFMELSFGQFASLGPITIWKASPLFKGLGYAMVIVSGIIGLYYSVIIGYCFFYLFSSMTSVLPWSHCDHDWNSPDCMVDSPPNISAQNVSNTVSVGIISPLNATKLHRTSPSEEFFNINVLDLSGDLNELGHVRWQLALCLLLAWIVVFLVLVKGIRSLGKVVYFTATFPYLLLTALLVRGLTLDGAMDGISYYLSPQWDRLQDSTVWSDAATQVFYSLSACSGGLILMSSFNKFNNFCLRDALIVPCVDCLTSFFSGFVIFTVLGFMAHSKGVSVADVAAAGPGLAFVAYPEAISNMPAPTVWAILFFIMMLVIGFSSEFSMIETVISSISDEYKYLLRKNWRNSTLFRIVVCVAFFTLSLPMTTRGGMYLLDIVDVAIGGFPLLVVGLVECIAIHFVYGYKNFACDIEMMIGRKPRLYWRVCWCFLTPAILGAVIVFKASQSEPYSYEGVMYPASGQAIGWLVCAFPISAIFIWMLITCVSSASWKNLKKTLKPTSDWGPALAENKAGTRYDTTTLTTVVVNEGSMSPEGTYNPAFDPGLEECHSS